MFISFCIHLYAFSLRSLYLRVSSFHFAFISFCVPFILLSCSFHLCSFPFIFLSYSFHFNSNVHSCPVIFLLFACISFHVAIMSFHFFLKLWKWLEGLARGSSATNGYVLLSYRYGYRQTTPPTYITLFEGNLPQKRHRERERETEREETKKRASELDA